MLELQPGGRGSLITKFPIFPGCINFPLSSRTSIWYPGAALPVEPYLISNRPNSGKFPAIDQPVSVCHQWSITGTFNLSIDHLIVSGSALSPAKKRYLKFFKLYLLISSPVGSIFFIARKAVGAVNIVETLCSDITLQNCPASGVPTGLPSYNTVVQPYNKGA